MSNYYSMAYYRVVVAVMLTYALQEFPLFTLGVTPSQSVHPFNVIVGYTEKCSNHIRLSRKLKKEFPELTDAEVEIIEKSDEAFDLQEDVEEVHRERNLKALNELLNLRRGSHFGGSLSRRQFEGFGIDVIKDPLNIVDSRTLSRLANYLQCWSFPPQPDYLYPWTAIFDEPDVIVHALVKPGEEGRPVFIAPRNSIRFRSEDKVTPNDYIDGDDWHLKQTRIMEAWTLFTGSTKGLDIAVVDTGCSFHPDLAPNLWIDPTNPKCKGADASHPTREPGCYGWDFSAQPGVNVSSYFPYYGRGNPLSETVVHGTGVAGMIAAVPNNNFGTAGVCWGCKVACLKITDYNGDFTTSAIIEAYNFILRRGIKISNHSYSGHNIDSPAVDFALRRLARSNHLVVAAAGNRACSLDKAEGDGTTCEEKYKSNGISIGRLFPGGIDEPNILNVGSVDISEKRSQFSTYGSKNVHLMAPGNSVRALAHTVAFRGNLTISTYGTSFSAPMVAGAAALVWGANPHLTAGEVKQRLLKTSKKVPQLKGVCSSGGMLDVYAALQNSLHSDVSPLDYTTPAQDLTTFFYSAAY